MSLKLEWPALSTRDQARVFCKSNGHHPAESPAISMPFSVGGSSQGRLSEKRESGQCPLCPPLMQPHSQAYAEGINWFHKLDRSEKQSRHRLTCSADLMWL